MAVYKEDAYMLEKIEKSQGELRISYRPSKDSAFYGWRGIPTGFDLNDLDSGDEKCVAQLRQFCSDNKDGATITHPKGDWRFQYDMCEGYYGWMVTIEKHDHYLAVSLKPYQHYEE